MQARQLLDKDEYSMENSNMVRMLYNSHIRGTVLNGLLSCTPTERRFFVRALRMVLYGERLSTPSLARRA